MLIAPPAAPPESIALPPVSARAETLESSVPVPAAKPSCCGSSALQVLTLILIGFLATWHGWRSNFVFAPSDALQIAAPWKTSPAEYTPRNVQLYDQTTQFIPWTIYSVDRLKHGQIPLWNPYAGLGQPFLANGQSAIFYPSMLLHLSFAETWSWTLSAFFRLLAAGIGVWLLARYYGLTGIPRLLPAVAFMLCGFNVVWLNHPQMNVMPLLPWAVLLVELLLRRITLMRILGASAIFALQFLGGHPATSVHLLLTCGLLALGRAFIASPRISIGRWFAGAGTIAATILFGFALAAVQWLPLIEYAENSGAKVVREDKLHHQPLIAITPSYLVGLLFPYANGYTPDGISPFELRQATHLPNTNELAVGFIGTVPLVLAILAIAGIFCRQPDRPGCHRAELRLWSLIGLIALLIAIRFPLIDHIVRRIPALNVSQNARLLGVTALSLSLLSGFGLLRLLALIARVRPAQPAAIPAPSETPPAAPNTADETSQPATQSPELTHLNSALIAKPRRPWTLPRVLLTVAMVLLMIGGLTATILTLAKGPILRSADAKAKAQYELESVHENSLEHVYSLVRRVHTELLLTSARLLIPASLLALMALLILKAKQAQSRAEGTRPSHQFFQIALLTLASLDLLAFAIPYNPGSPASTYPGHHSASTPPVVSYLREQPQARVAGTFSTFTPELATAYQIPDLRSYDALAPRRTYNFWAHPNLGGLPPAAQGYLSRLVDEEHPAWQLLSLTYLMTPVNQPDPDPALWKFVEQFEETNLYRSTSAKPRAWIASRAQVFANEQAVLDHLAALTNPPTAQPTTAPTTTLPNDLVLLEGAIPSELLTPATGASRSTAELAAPRRVDEEIRPEIVRVRITNPAGGWLVLADAYHPGWTATLINEQQNTGHELTIYPAFGALRAVAIPNGIASGRGAASSYLIEFRYRPWSFRIGAMTSALSAGLFLLLMAIAIFPKVRRKISSPPPFPPTTIPAIP